jgi:hypothetical protein
MMPNNKDDGFKQVQIKKSLIRKIKALAFNNEVEIRVIASGLVELALADTEKVEELMKKLKVKKNE